MNSLPRFFFYFVVCICLSLQAKDLSSYKVGEVADADIATPLALDVVDAAATAALQSAKARQYPAVFRSYPDATNNLEREFLAAFAQARTEFLAEMTNEFHSSTLDEAAVASANFGNLVTAFGVEHKNFPVTDELAAEWAHGADGRDIQEKLLATLQWAANRRVRPDELPAGMNVGETIRLAPVAVPDQKLPFETVQQGQVVPASSLITVSNAQAMFRREFPPGQQLFARALATFIKPNCLPDAPFTQLTRGTAVCQMIVSDHFDAGDAIVRRGNVIDAKTKTALVALDEKLKSLPPAPSVAADVQLSTPAAAAAAHSQSFTRQKPGLKTGLRHQSLILALAGTAAVALLVACWQFFEERKRSASATSGAQVPLPFLGATQDNLTPQVTQAVREAVHQELTSQRRELLAAQQVATDEIAALVQRLDELQVPMQTRLHTYETRIQMLEKELALRNEENRQLLKVKIEMINRQLEIERAATLTPAIPVFNGEMS